MHVLTAVIDPQATVSAVAVFVPLPSGRYGLWLGLAALALDLVVALVVTSLLRHRLSLRLWRAVHWLAYLAWPVALLHGAGMGTDAGSTWMLAVDAACIAIFAGAVVLRVINAPRAGGQAPRAGEAAGPRDERRRPPAHAYFHPAPVASAVGRADLAGRARRPLRPPAPPARRVGRADRRRSRRAACADGAAPAFRRTSSCAQCAPSRAPIVVANGVEGEPPSHKDKLLMRTNPHLVLDGAEAAAAAVGARQIVIAVGRGATSAHDSMAAAIAERPRAGGASRSSSSRSPTASSPARRPRSCSG